MDKVRIAKFRGFQIEYDSNCYPNQRFGQAFCNKFYSEHSCPNGCELERIYYTNDRKIAEARIHHFCITYELNND